MTKDVKEALNTCGRNMALITEENCLEILYLAREEILQEIIMGMIDSLKDDSPAIYEIFLKSNNTIVKLKALEKIYNEDFLKKYISEEDVYSDNCVRMKVFGKIEDKKFLKELLKEKAIYERTAYLYKVSEQFEDKDLYEIITSDNYNFKIRLFFISKIRDRKYLEKIINESEDVELITEAKFCLEHLD